MALCNGDSKVSVWRGDPCFAASGGTLGSVAREPPLVALPRPLSLTRQRSFAARAAASQRATGRGLWHVFFSRAAGAFVDFVCVPGFLRPPSSGRRGRRQLLAAARLALASPAPLWGAEPAERGPRVGGREASGFVCTWRGGLPHPSSRPFRKLGAFYASSRGPPKAGQGCGLVCEDRAGPSYRLPATPFPACLR